MSMSPSGTSFSHRSATSRWMRAARIAPRRWMPTIAIDSPLFRSTISCAIRRRGRGRAGLAPGHALGGRRECARRAFAYFGIAVEHRELQPWFAAQQLGGHRAIAAADLERVRVAERIAAERPRQYRLLREEMPE